MVASSEILDRMPPVSLEAEQALLGACILKPAVLDDVAEIVAEASFYGDGNRQLWRCLRGLSDRNHGIDLSILIDRLRSTGDLEAIGGPAYLAELYKNAPNVSYARHYAEIVAEKAKLRTVIDASVTDLGAAYAANRPAADILDRPGGPAPGCDDQRPR